MKHAAAIATALLLLSGCPRPPKSEYVTDRVCVETKQVVAMVPVRAADGSLVLVDTPVTVCVRVELRTYRNTEFRKS